jgi:hypothetical protein
MVLLHKDINLHLAHSHQTALANSSVPDAYAEYFSVLPGTYHFVRNHLLQLDEIQNLSIRQS